MINCDFEECTSLCKNYYICSLHTPFNQRLGELRSMIIWDYKRIHEINKGINHCKEMIYAFNHNELPEIVSEYFSERIMLEQIRSLREEKNQLVSELRELQIKEKNIMKILKRR